MAGNSPVSVLVPDRDRLVNRHLYPFGTIFPKKKRNLVAWASKRTNLEQELLPGPRSWLAVLVFEPIDFANWNHPPVEPIHGLD